MVILISDRDFKKAYFHREYLIIVKCILSKQYYFKLFAPNLNCMMWKKYISKGINRQSIPGDFSI